MKPVLVLYATREGHTRHIGEYLASAVRARGLSADLMDAAKIPPEFSFDAYNAAILTASVHREQHEKEMVQFVKRHVPELERIPTAFLSVSLSEAGVEDREAPPDRRAQAASDVQRIIDAFLAETGWHPTRIQAVAGALLYTQYNFLLRFVMKWIARQAGGDTDTSRDFEYTDWKALDHLVDEFLLTIPAGAHAS